MTDMSTVAKIAVFWVCIYLALWLLRRHPNSAISRFAFSWQGPFPAEGELKSSYYRRKAIFALGWLAQIAALLALVMYTMPRSKSIATPMMLAMFALAIGFGMAVLGALLAALTSFKARWLGPNPAFSLIRPEHEVDDEADGHEPHEV